MQTKEVSTTFPMTIFLKKISAIKEGENISVRNSPIDPCFGNKG
jgi:hypothetical protein